MSTIVFNFAILVTDVAAVWAMRRAPRLMPCAAAVGAVGAASVIATVVLAGGGFQAMRLLSLGVFLHVPFVLMVGAGVVWRSSPRASLVALSLVLLIGAVGVDAFFIEPTWLEVTRVTIASDKITRPVTIAIVADLQTDRIGAYERRVLRRVMEERPDMILFAGDYLQTRDAAHRETLREELNSTLREIGLDAPLGVFAVRGNVDLPSWPGIFDSLGVTCFSRTESIAAGEILVTGLSMRDSFDTSLSIAASDKFQIALGHSPNFALGRIGADLLVAGHTHGGQVRLPLIGPITTLSRLPQDWAVGRTDFGDGRTLLVSRGVGMERGSAPRLRFLCRPELIFVELGPR